MSRSSNGGLPHRIAIISDPHGDLVALKAVVADLARQEPVDEVLIGGDIAQGGPQPADVVDLIRSRGWPSVRGNSDELLCRIADGEPAVEAVQDVEGHSAPLPQAVVERARWSVERLGPERIDYLRTLPRAIERGPYFFGTAVLVHATPWSTEDVVLPDAELSVLERMVRDSRARVVMYGHIHTAYQRRAGNAVVLSVGAVYGSNDTDPRPAYTIVTLGDPISAEVRRVSVPTEARIAAFATAGLKLTDHQKAVFDEAGTFPVRSRPGVRVSLWP